MLLPLIAVWLLSWINGTSISASEMKKLAARNFEDLLQVRSTISGIKKERSSHQCSIPVFEGLLQEPYNTIVMMLLYQTAEWHAFAKLWLHTESTLQHLEQ